MNFFSNALDRLMNEPGRRWSQTELERRSGVTQSQISRYLKGVPPEADALTNLCKPFGDDAAALVAAWLKDLTPDDLRRLVLITVPAGSKVAEEESADILKGLPPHARKVLTNLADVCRKDPDMVTATASLLSISRHSKA